jgi:hypothetical protein
MALSSATIILFVLGFGAASFSQWVFCGFSEQNACHSCLAYNVEELCNLPSYDLFLNTSCVLVLCILPWNKRTRTVATNSEIQLENNAQFSQASATNIANTDDRYMNNVLYGP